MNFMLLEVFPVLKQQYRQRLIQFFNETFKLNLQGLDICLSYLFRALSDGNSYINLYLIPKNYLSGVEFRETCKYVLSIAQIINANRQWIIGLKKNSLVLADIFAFMSRFVADLQLAVNCGVPTETFKTTLISTCEFLIHERFADLASTMGQDLFISLMRLSKLQQFWNVWKMLLHNASSLVPNLSMSFKQLKKNVIFLLGLQQQLLISPSTQYLGSRVSVHISRKIESFLRTIKQQMGLNLPNSKITADLSKYFEPLKNAVLLFLNAV